MKILTGQVVDVVGQEIFPGEITIKNGKIATIKRMESAPDQWLLPGLVDAHVHIESSMLVPAEFARLAVVHGTVATVSDPHEIANVLGIDGVRYMIDNGKNIPFHFHFGAPSCVPATDFETAGARLGIEEVEYLLDLAEIGYLSEMMNYPGVLFDDEIVMGKIQAAIRRGMPIDGHAPGLSGKDLEKYIQAGISTDHECFTLEEAKEKLSLGMKILIREGSAAKNFDALWPLLLSNPEDVMFCSDDKHPDDLVKGHINKLVAKAVRNGVPVLQAVSAATINPIKHYKLPLGLLQAGDSADITVVDSPENMNVLLTMFRGETLAENGQSMVNYQKTIDLPLNNFSCRPVKITDIEIPDMGGEINVIEALEGQLVTRILRTEPRVVEDKIVSDPERDILKLVVLNRYEPANPAVGFIKNIGLKNGAIASTVAHDSHNIIATGSDDALIVEAINKIISIKGGISAVNATLKLSLALPVAGLMTDENGHQVARKYEAIDKTAKQMGSQLSAPFMTLSFMALLVIPDLKLSDRGLFSGSKFDFHPLQG